MSKCLHIFCQFSHSSQRDQSKNLLVSHLHQSCLMSSYCLPQLLPFKVWVGRVPQTFAWGFTKNSHPIMIPPFFLNPLISFHHYVSRVASYWKPKPISLGVQHTILRLFPIVLDEKGAADWNHLVQFIWAWPIMSQLRFRCLSYLCWQLCMFIFCWPFSKFWNLLAHIDVTRHSAANYI